MSPYVIGRNEELYGPDANVFRPERFLEDPDWASKVLTFDFAWGYGNRRCLGKVLAMLILRKTLFEVSQVPHNVNNAYTENGSFSDTSSRR
jgi:cytochrome P450